MARTLMVGRAGIKTITAGLADYFPVTIHGTALAGTRLGEIWAQNVFYGLWNVLPA